MSVDLLEDHDMSKVKCTSLGLVNIKIIQHRSWNFNALLQLTPEICYMLINEESVENNSEKDWLPKVIIV